MNHEKENTSTDGRMHYVDAARGAALLLLVLGHIVTGNSFVFNWIFSFHMPLFYFLAGMCTKGAEGGFLPYVKLRAKKRLMPYFCIVLIGFLICMLIPSYRKVIIDDGFLTQTKHIFILMKPINLYIGQVWFLASLFWAEVYFYLWYRVSKNRGFVAQIAAAALLVVIARNLWRIQGFVPVIGRIPFHMDSAFMGAFCYILGYITKRDGMMERLDALGKWRMFPVLLAAGINVYFGAFLNGYVNMCDLVFGNVFYFVIAMVSGVTAAVAGAYCAGRCRILEWYGRHSLLLFASHTFLIYLVRYWVFEKNGVWYTMMGDVPWKIAVVMTGMVGILFGVVGVLVDGVMKK